MNINGFVINAIWDKCSVVLVRAFPIDENTIWYPKVFPCIKGLPQSLHLKTEPSSLSMLLTNLKYVIRRQLSRKFHQVLTVWFFVYQSPIKMVISPSGVAKGRGIMARGFIINPPYPPDALWRLRDGK